MYRFEKRRVYQNAVELVKTIYKITIELPSDEKFALIDQLKRSAISVVLNIAEGSGGLGDKEYKSYLRNALKSLYEIIAALKIAEQLFVVDVSKALLKCDSISKELHSLIKSLNRE